MEEKIANEILDILQNNGKALSSDIAKMIGIDEETVEATIKKLEKDKIIAKYCAVINREELEGEYAEALVEVGVIPQRDRGYDDVAKRIYRFPEVKAVYLMSGTYDLAVLLESDNVKKISKFVFEKIAVIDGVRKTATHFIMRKYKEQGAIFAEEEKDTRLVVSP